MNIRTTRKTVDQSDCVPFRVRMPGVWAKSVLTILALLCAEQAAANIMKFTGRAVNRNGELEYVEKHIVKYEDGTVSESKTVYFDSGDRQIGDLVSDYAEGPQYGSYEFRDLRTGYEDGARVKADRIVVFHRIDPDTSAKTKELQRIENQIVGQGFTHFIANNLDSVADGKTFHVRLVLPSRLNQYKFRIRLRKINNDIATIRLEIDNWFLRLIAPYVEAEYSLKTKRLLRYEGISNMTDSSGKYRKVIITYEYHPQVEG